MSSTPTTFHVLAVRVNPTYEQPRPPAENKRRPDVLTLSVGMVIGAVLVASLVFFTTDLSPKQQPISDSTRGGREELRQMVLSGKLSPTPTVESDSSVVKLVDNAVESESALPIPSVPYEDPQTQISSHVEPPRSHPSREDRVLDDLIKDQVASYGD